MKKQLLTLATVFALVLSGFAQEFGGFGNNSQRNGGFFQKGPNDELFEYREMDKTPMMPMVHGSQYDFTGDGTLVPLGSGIAVLLGLGAAYAFAKKREK